MCLYRAAADTRDIASVLRKQAVAAYSHSDFDETLRIATAALEHCRNLDDSLGIADASFSLGCSFFMKDKDDEALLILRESLEICRTHGNDVGAARCLKRIGEIPRVNWQKQEALSTLNEAVEVASRSGDQLGVARALLTVGDTHFDLSDFVKAAEVLSETKTIARNIGWDHGVIRALCQMGIVKTRSEDYREAEELFQESISTARHKRMRWGLAWTLHGFGKCLQEQAKLDEAAQVLGESCLLYQALSLPKQSLWVAERLTRLRRSQGEWAKALFWYDHIIAIHRGQQEQWGVANTLERKGEILVRAGRYLTFRSRYRGRDGERIWLRFGPRWPECYSEDGHEVGKAVTSVV